MNTTEKIQHFLLTAPEDEREAFLDWVGREFGIEIKLKWADWIIKHEAKD